MKEKLRENYIRDEENGVWIKKDAAEYHYSDGDSVEEGISKLLDGVVDRSVLSDEMTALQKDWPTFYYFSSRRANLLRPLAKKLLSGARVLELGCGMGAVTRYLGETCAEVVAVEGSRRRGAVAAKRCADLPNVTVLIDEIKSLPANLGKFDVVTLIGVLEYARRYGGPGAEVKMLETAKSFLKPDGFLILAIENKLGLKYFAGVPEDHLGRRWIGITNGYRDDSICTWSRKELTELLSKAGFAHWEQFLVLPDYKLPVSVVTPLGLQTPEFNLEAFLCQSSRPFEQMPFFNMSEAWQSVFKGGLLADLADSLCFVATPGKSREVFEEGVLADHYGNTGIVKAKFAKRVCIKKGDNAIKVEKTRIAPGESPQTENLLHMVKNESYHNGELLSSRLSRIVMRRDWTLEEFFEALTPLVDILKGNMDSEGLCDGALMDLTPFNIVMEEDGPRAFDLEWVSKERLPIQFILYRGIYHTLGKLIPMRKSSKHNVSTFLELFEEFIKRLNLPVAEISPDQLWWKEGRFMQKIKPENKKMPRKDFSLLYMD